ncbi:hypothetical protein CNR22_24175 [Sphingobacteriaceae bacterium]|nr:hypothetical protein CNR22_24175 [Sphingobacteriaceae bacterium]
MKTHLFYLIVFGICISKTLFGGPAPDFISSKDPFGTRVFVENRGQYDNSLPSKDKVHFVLDNGLEKIYFTDKGLVYEMSKFFPLTERQREEVERGNLSVYKKPELHYVTMNWLNANKDIVVERSEKQMHYITYGPSHYNSSTFKKITYKNVYKNIDIEYTIPADKECGIKYNVIIHPGADPAQIKLAYTGDVTKIKKDGEGNIVIKTSLWDIKEYLPKSFYEDKTPVVSGFNLSDKTIGFSFPNNFSHDKTLIIDPWVTSVTSLSSNNYAYDVDYDFGGNTYIYGGYNLFKVARYSSTGALVWTFSGTVTTPAWNSTPLSSYASNFGVDKYSGKTYIGQAYSSSGNEVIRIDAAGNYDNFVNTANNQFEEVWDMGFHCVTGEVFVLGGGTTSNISAVTINPTTAVINLTTFQPSNPNAGQDIVSHAIDNSGKIFIVYAGGGLNDNICLVNTTFNGNVWTAPSTFTVLNEAGNKSQYVGGTGVNSNGFNCLAVNNNYLFYYDGIHLASYNKATGALVTSVTVSGLNLLEQGGIAVDDCNNLYLGGNTNILCYAYNGTAFSTLTPVSLSVAPTTTNQYVYDIKLDKPNKRLYVSGSGFVGTYPAMQSFACPTATSPCFFSVAQDYNICAGQSVSLSVVNSISLTGASFSMQPGSFTNTTGNFTVTPSSTTVYSLYVTGTNQANVVVTNSAISTVSVFPQPSFAPTFTQSSCTSTFNAIDLHLTFNPASPVPSHTITWAPLPTTFTSNTQTSGSNLTPGAYSATVATDWGCTAVANFTMNPIPLPPVFNINPPGGNYLITCLNPTLELVYTPSTTVTYTSSNGSSAPIYGPSAVFSATNSFGTWTVIALNPLSGCISTKTFVINTNTFAPSSTVTPLFQNITCSVTSVITVTAYGSPSVNISHAWIAPQGGTLTAGGYSTTFVPGSPGIYTHCAINDANGCRSCKEFTVASSSGFPTYTLSSPQNFTLGCGSKSVATINILNASTTPTPGGPVSYTLLGPPTSTTVPSGSLSTNATYSVVVPGTWTVITKDNTNFCETRVQVSVLQNTLGPQANAVVPQLILDCNTPSVVLEGQSLNTNVSYVWSFPGNPGNVASNTITVLSNSLATTSTVLANYTLTVTDENNTCKTTTVIPMLQNLFKPNAVINGGNQITCSTATLILTNGSNSTIPPVYPHPQAAVALLWQGPTPQTPLQLSTTYVAGLPGVYTVTIKDLNNGCLSTGTKTVADFRQYPSLNRPKAPEPFVLDCGAKSLSIKPIYGDTQTSYTYSWTSPGPAIGTNTNSSLVVSGPGRYQVNVVNSLNDCASGAFVDVVDGDLTGDFVAEPNSGTAPLKVLFYNNSSSTTNNTGISSYWNFGNGTTQSTNSVSISPETVFNAPGTYTVTMFVTKGTCLDTVRKVVNVEIPSELKIPNIFSPNNDGVNDIFFVKATNLTKISITIFDRWGHKVYTLDSSTGNIEWDGKNPAGKDAAEGVFTYIITAKGSDGKDFNTSGTITLVR